MGLLNKYLLSSVLIVAVTGQILAQSALSDNPKLRSVVLGFSNPAEYRDDILRNLDQIVRILKTTPTNKPDLDVNQFLGALNLDWGNYDDSVFFASKDLTNSKPSFTSLRILCAARYSRGDVGVIDELAARWPQTREVSMYDEFDNYLKSEKSVELTQRWLRKQCVIGGSSAFVFLNAFLSHPKYLPPLVELDALTGQIEWFFQFWSGLNLRAAKQGDEAKLPTSQHVFNSMGRYFNASIISMDLAYQYRRLKEDGKANEWVTRSLEEFREAAQSGDLQAAWKNRLHITAVRLKIHELELVTAEVP